MSKTEFTIRKQPAMYGQPESWMVRGDEIRNGKRVFTWQEGPDFPTEQEARAFRETIQ